MRKLVVKEHLEDWATSVPAKGSLPELMNLLVRATSPFITYLNFPAGSAVYTRGYDGEVVTTKGTEYVPEGNSLWELSTEKTGLTKAERDYQKRKEKPVVPNPLDCTLVLVMLGEFESKVAIEKWVKEKNEEKFWKEVRLYDSAFMEQWLMYSLPVSKWLLSVLNKNQNYFSILTAEEWWMEWSIGPIQLPPESITPGRELESKKLIEYINGNNPTNILRVSGHNREEAVAFAIGTVKLADESTQKNFNARTLVVENMDDFRIAYNYPYPQIIIANIDDATKVHVALNHGHHVIVPVSADDPSDSDIRLPGINMDALVEALTKAGLSREVAHRDVRDSGGNFTILRRFLGFSEGKLDWAKAPYAEQLLPALILGRWSEDFPGDKEVIEALSGTPYSVFVQKISPWREKFLYQIGNTWRLISPMDAWTNLSPFLSKAHLELFAKQIDVVCKYISPELDLPSESRMMASLLGKSPNYSAWCREGLLQSLIMIAVFGDRLKMPVGSSQRWVDSLVHSIIQNAEGRQWISLNRILPLLAEASPNSFLDSIESSLKSTNAPIMAMFAEEPGFLTPSSHHTGLLWALEEIAWVPDLLSRASLLLCNLDDKDPGGSLSNRPLNSLKSIFRLWHHQTFASLQERMDVLKLISKKNPSVAWKLLPSLIPDSNDIGDYTHKFKWRLREKSFTLTYTYEEIFSSVTTIVDLLISNFKYDEEMLARLISVSNKEYITPDNRQKILNFVRETDKNIKHVTYAHWNKLRSILYRHRAYKDAKWAFKAEQLKPYQSLYDNLTPNDVLQKHLWYFTTPWPEFPEGKPAEDEDLDTQQNVVNEERDRVISLLLREIGLTEILSMARTVDDPWNIGWALASVVNSEKDTFSIIKLFEISDEKFRRLASGFLSRKTSLESNNWLFQIADKMKKNGIDGNAISKLFQAVEPSRLIWEYIEKYPETNETYWKNIRPFFYRLSKEDKELGLKKLMQFKRFVTATMEASHFSSELPTELIVELLTMLSSEQTEEETKLNGHEVDKLLNELDGRKDVERQTMINLEVQFIPILASYGSHRKPKLLHEELSTNPKFFVDALKLAYLPKDRSLLDKERENLTEEQIANQGRRGYELLNSMHRIPGTQNDGTIDTSYLKKWVAEVRQLASAESRLEVADMKIGQILAHYNVVDGKWPPDVLSIIEDTDSPSMGRNFSAELFNMRGSSSRMPYDGGNIERGHAAFFLKLFENYKNSYPRVSSIFLKLSQGYEEDAKRMDDEAKRDKLDYF